jgi:hypothetical protein
MDSGGFARGVYFAKRFRKWSIKIKIGIPRVV